MTSFLHQIFSYFNERSAALYSFWEHPLTSDIQFTALEWVLIVALLLIVGTVVATAFLLVGRLYLLTIHLTFGAGFLLIYYIQEALLYLAQAPARIFMRVWRTIFRSRAEKARPEEDTSYEVPESGRDPWDLLNVPRTATKSEIRGAYKTLAKLYHPDRLGSFAEKDRKFAEEYMKAINSAYDRLMQISNSSRS